MARLAANRARGDKNDDVEVPEPVPDLANEGKKWIKLFHPSARMTSKGEVQIQYVRRRSWRGAIVWLLRWALLSSQLGWAAAHRFRCVSDAFCLRSRRGLAWRSFAVGRGGGSQACAGTADDAACLCFRLRLPFAPQTLMAVRKADKRPVGEAQDEPNRDPVRGQDSCRSATEERGPFGLPRCAGSRRRC